MKLLTKIIFFLLLVFPLSQSKSLECPDNSYEFNHKSLFKNEKRVWCQIKVNDKFIKHGPEKITDDKGKITINTFEMGVLQNKTTKVISKSVPAKEEDKKHTLKSNEVKKKLLKIKNSKTYTRRWPSDVSYLGGVGYRVENEKSIIKKKYITFATELLLEMNNTTKEIEDNIFYDAFTKIPNINRDQIKKLSNYYLNKVKTLNRPYNLIYAKKTGILVPLYRDFKSIISKVDVEMARIFLDDFGVSPVYNGEYVLTPFLVAARSEKGKAILQMILKRKENPNQAFNCFANKYTCEKKKIMEKCTPLDMASKGGALGNMQLLFEFDANVDGLPGVTKTTPLIQATIGRKHKAIKFLIESGAEVHKAEEGHKCRIPPGNAMGVAMLKLYNQDTSDFLLQNGGKLKLSEPHILSSALSFFTRKFARRQKIILKKVLWLEKKGFNFEEQLNLSDTPVVTAAQEHYPDVMNFFINKGVDINKLDGNGRSPVFHVFQSVSWPNSKKPKIYNWTRKNESEAKKNARLEIIKLMFNKKAKRQILDEKNKGLLYYADLENPHNKKIIKYLKDKGSK